MRPEGLGKLKTSIRLNGSRTRDLPDCSVVPEPLHYCVAQQFFVHYLCRVWTSARNILAWNSIDLCQPLWRNFGWMMLVSLLRICSRSCVSACGSGAGRTAAAREWRGCQSGPGHSREKCVAVDGQCVLQLDIDTYWHYRNSNMFRVANTTLSSVV
jgi:hypothetical protein